MKVALLALTCGLAMLPSSSARAAGLNLCREQENPLFTYQLQNKKFAAACTLDDPKAPNGSSLIYRFGAPGHIELTLPKDPTQLQLTTFTDASSNYEPAEDDHYLRFTNGAFTYILYSVAGDGFDLAGLGIFQQSRLLKKLPCEFSSVNNSMVYNSLVAMGVQAESDTHRPYRFWSQLLPKRSVVLKQKPFGDPKYSRPPGTGK